MFGIIFWIRIFFMNLLCIPIIHVLTKDITSTIIFTILINVIKIGIEYIKFKDEARRLAKLEIEIEKQKK